MSYPGICSVGMGLAPILVPRMRLPSRFPLPVPDGGKPHPYYCCQERNLKSYRNNSCKKPLRRSRSETSSEACSYL